MSRKSIKTYGVYGMIEYVLTLDIGGRQEKVTFNGGSITQQGIHPATYTTGSQVIQWCLEHHRSFQRGRIQIVGEVAVTEDEASGEATKGDEDEAGIQPADETGIQRLVDEHEGAETGGRTVEVSCLQDAQAWLSENFGIAARRVRTRAAVIAAGKEQGVTFEGI